MSLSRSFGHVSDRCSVRPLISLDELESANTCREIETREFIELSIERVRKVRIDIDSGRTGSEGNRRDSGGYFCAVCARVHD